MTLDVALPMLDEVVAAVADGVDMLQGASCQVVDVVSVMVEFGCFGRAERADAAFGGEDDNSDLSPQVAVQVVSVGIEPHHAKVLVSRGVAFAGFADQAFVLTDLSYPGLLLLLLFVTLQEPGSCILATGNTNRPSQHSHALLAYIANYSALSKVELIFQLGLIAFLAVT